MASRHRVDTGQLHKHKHSPYRQAGTEEYNHRLTHRRMQKSRETDRYRKQNNNQ